jgi:hypothetical protein
MDTETKTRNNRAILDVDDLDPNDLVTVHSSKITEDAIPAQGMAFQVKVIQLPFICCQIIGNGQPCVLDSRYVNFMRISKEYADAVVGKFPEGT